MRLQSNASPGNGKEAVGYADLLSQAHEAGLKGIQTQLLVTPNDENGRLAIVKATIETELGRFEGLGDADPGNVESFLAPHLIRVAETRAKARALRDAVNCGVVSFEELDGEGSRTGSFDPGAGASSDRSEPRRSLMPPRAARTANGSEGPMSEAQRRYLFRLLAGQGYKGAEAEDYLRERLGVQQISRASRADASALIDELVQSAPDQGAGGGRLSHPQR